MLRCERVLCVCFVINYSFNTVGEAITYIIMECAKRFGTKAMLQLCCSFFNYIESPNKISQDLESPPTFKW